MKLSIIMMVKNESKYLSKCLESLTPILANIESEIVIVDTGSEDDTVEIAKRYTDNIYFHPWNDNFAEMRNITVSYAKGEWLFMVDGDEVLQNPEPIVDFFQSDNYRQYYSASITEKNITNEKDETSYSVFYPVRLFKRTERFRFVGAIHEQPLFEYPMVDINSTLLHYGYLSTDKALMDRKFLRTSHILKEELRKEPENEYYWYQLSVTYGMHNDLDEAVEAIDKAYEIIKKRKTSQAIFMHIYAHRTVIRLLNNQLQETEDAGLEALRIQRDHIDMYFYIAKAQLLLQKYRKAEENYNNYLRLLDRSKNASLSKNSSITYYTLGKEEQAYFDLCNLYYKIKEYEKVLHCFNKVKSNNLIKSCFSLIIQTYISLNKYDELITYYEENVSNSTEYNNAFCINLENLIQKHDENTRGKIMQAFSKSASLYGILNRIRLSEYNTSIDKFTIDEYTKELDFNKLPVFFGEIIYYYINNKYDVTCKLKLIKENNLNSIFQYLTNKFPDLCGIISGYLEMMRDSREIEAVRVRRSFEKYMILLDGAGDYVFNRTFRSYIEDGIYYIKMLYSQYILDEEKISELKSPEEIFFLYMYKANKKKDFDKAGYISYIRKALSTFPAMKKGVELLLDEIKENENVYSRELDEYKTKVKSDISRLIIDGRYEEAVNLIEEYESIISDDVEIASMKSVIAVNEGRLDEGESILVDALNIESDNFDLIYNLACIYQTLEKDEEAIKWYSKAYEFAPNDEFKKAIHSTICDLKNIKDNGGRGIDPEIHNIDIGNNIKGTLSGKRVLYLGWLGNDNVGDDLLFETFKKLFYMRSGRLPFDVSIDGYFPQEDRDVDLARYDLVVLGGGSLLTLDYWEDICINAGNMKIPVVIWGTGIDIRNSKQIDTIINAFEHNYNISLGREKTAEVVRLAQMVGVRGQVDKYLIGDNKAAVIGDPGMIWNKLFTMDNDIDEIDNFINKDDKETVLVNWGTSYNNISGENEKNVEYHLGKAMTGLINGGYKIIIYPMWSEDIGACRILSAAFDKNSVFCIDKVYDACKLSGIIDKCKFSINLKLHANILSMSLGKPFISLAYGLKCYDFADSVGYRKLVVDTSKLSSDVIIDKAQYIVKNYNLIQRSFNNSISDHYDKQIEYMDRIICMLSLPRTTTKS